MFPKYSFIIYLSIVQRDMRSIQFSPSQGFPLLFVQPRELWRQLATCCCGCSKGLTQGDEKKQLQEEAPFRHPVALANGGSASFYPPTKVLLCSNTKANNGHLLSPGGDKQKESIKLPFENSAIKLPATPRTWPESTFLPTTGSYCPF